jgi:isoleucyl-tRNA synthetase
MFEPVPSSVDFVKQEHDVLKFWKDSQAFKKLKELRKGASRWSFIDGPITANNPMGVHHGWGRTYKDLFHRFKSMQGFSTRYQNGFDCQGLWVEVNVEKEMGFRSKRDIEEFGLAEFVKLCKQRVLKFAAVQTRQSERLGYWMEWDDPAQLDELAEQLGKDPTNIIELKGPAGSAKGTVEEVIGQLGMPHLGGSYYTFSDENNYSIWSVLKSCHERGWVYKGRDVMPWCGRCGTGLSQHEIVTEGYQELTHPGITLRFPLREEQGASLLVWTTTPWTLTSNVAAAVGPDLDYVQVRQGDETFYLSKGALPTLKGEYETVREVTGGEMEGWTYTGPFDELTVQVESDAPGKHRIILWDEVGEEEGTGIVHIAPGAGAEDYQLSKEHDLPVIAPLDDAGKFVEGFDWLSGMHVTAAATPIYENLEQKGLAYKLEDYTHRYPVCWRCSEELVFRLVDEWFINMGQQLDKPYEQVTEEEKKANLRYQMMEVVREETSWFPSFGHERELDWLRNMHDWMISKKRYWGLALPIYECHHCGNFEVVGSKEELEERAVEGWEDFSGHTPHRPYIDMVKIGCQHCGETVERIPDVGNPWLDAGIVGMSTLGYNHDRELWSQWFPADLISESFPGQFRNWFYSLLAMSTILERKAPFRNVFTYATLVAEDGRAMHKSWGNMIEFNEAADKMGVDVMRWVYSQQIPEKDLLFGYAQADETRRQFLLPLWNAYSFFVTYANIDGWTPGTDAGQRQNLLDRWILARLHDVILSVTELLEGFEPHRASRRVNEFLNDLTNWYLRRSRRRFWAERGESDADKNAAYSTLYEVLTQLSKLLAPFVPFVTEVLHQNLVRSHDSEALESVHHCKWPEPRAGTQNNELVEEMKLVTELVSLGHAARNQAQIKLRQPLKEVAFAVGSKADAQIIDKHGRLIQDELNVKQVRILDAVSEAAAFTLHPLPKQLGQKYESKFPAVRQAILELDQELAAGLILRGEAISIDAEGTEYQIEADEVEVRITAQPGFATVAEGANLTALVTEVTPELAREGLAREFVRRVQDLRKQAGFRVEDRIQIEHSSSAGLSKALADFMDHITRETLATLMVHSDSPKGEATAKHDFDGEHTVVALTRSGAVES